MLTMFHHHSRKILIALLVPVAFGCQPKQLNDLELSERMTAGSKDKIANIYVDNGRLIQGFYVAIRGDSLEWREGPTLMATRHTILTDSVSRIMVNGPNPYWAPICGLGGCFGGGIAGCVYEAKTADSSLTWTQFRNAVAIGAVTGAALGYGIGLVSDPGRVENAWIYKIPKPRK